MKIRSLKVENKAEKKLVEKTLGRKFEGNIVSFVGGSPDEAKISKLFRNLKETKKGVRS